MLIDRGDALAELSEDFGHVLRGRATGVVRPHAADDVVEIVNQAVAEGFALTPRACGHSAGGQSLPADSVVVDLTRMNRIDRVDASALTVRCQPGATLREVVAATMDIGLLPRR